MAVIKKSPKIKKPSRSKAMRKDPFVSAMKHPAGSIHIIKNPNDSASQLWMVTDGGRRPADGQPVKTLKSLGLVETASGKEKVVDHYYSILWVYYEANRLN